MDKKPKPALKPQIQPVPDIESESLEFHVAISRERHDEINARFDRVDARIEKLEAKMERGFSKVEKIIMWSVGTMFFTMISIYISSLIIPLMK